MIVTTAVFSNCFKRRFLIWRTRMIRCLLAVSIVCFTPVCSHAAPDRPNVLIVTVDDMNADSIGVYGCPLPNISPNMDRLVKSGLRFGYAHVQVGNCMPGRNVMWSGCYPHNNAVEGFIRSNSRRNRIWLM